MYLLLKFIVLVLVLSSTAYSAESSSDNNQDAIVQASVAYVAKSSSKLSSVYKSNPDSAVINYWYSSLMVTNNNLTPALEFLHTHQSSYYTKSLRIQVLQEYSKNHAWQNYLTLADGHYDELAESDKCSYNLANYQVNSTKNDTYLSSLAKNHPSGDCLELVKIALKDSSEDFRLMLANLIFDGKVDIFNSIASEHDIHPIHAHNSNSYKSLLDNKDIYGITYYFATKIKNNEFSSIVNEYKQIPDDTPYHYKNYLQNYLSFQLTLKQNFDQALLLTSNDNKVFLNDDAYEWKARLYLFHKNYSLALQAINNMPVTLRSKSSWLFWKAYSMLQQSNKANSINNVKATIYSINKEDLFYYFYAQILLAKIEHRKVGSLPAVDPKIANSCIYDNDIDDALTLYHLGKNNDDYNLMQLSRYLIQYHAVHNLNITQMLKLAQQLHDEEIYDISIMLAVKSGNTFDWDLSFPKPFYNNYKKYALSNNLDTNFVIAISRQESRFNSKVIAFDGGIGLMQLMPYTVQEISKKAGFDSCVYEYDCNIKFGVWYLGHLSKDFNNDLIYTSGAYNAGPNKAKIWYKNLTVLNDQYPDFVATALQTELIPVKITRGYVQKVLANKYVYDHL